jgi:polygalacturonase
MMHPFSTIVTQYKLALVGSIVLLAFGSANSQSKTIAQYTAEAPFKMPTVPLPSFPTKTFTITDYGAVSDGKTSNTEAFAKAITACNAAGGGQVIIPAGTWLTGPIELKSNVNLHTEKDAMVQFTADHTQYPMIKAGPGSTKLVPASPIYGYALNNIAITGSGTFDGAGDTWRPIKKSKVSATVWNYAITGGGSLSADGKVYWPDRAMMANDIRPYMLYLVGCTNILVENVTLRNSPKFVFYPSKCTNLSIIGANIYNDWWAQNGDGIDISACKNVVIYKTIVSCGDDGICMKSSGTPDAKDSANLSNVLIAECTVYRAHGGFVIGSNTDGGMKNIYVAKCNFIGSDIGVRIKSNSGRGGWVRDVFVKDIYMKSIVSEAILFDTYYDDVPAGKTGGATTTAGDKVPDFRNIYLNNIICEGAATAISITGLPNMTVKNIYFENMTLTTKKGFVSKNAEDIYLKHVTINASKPVYDTNGCKNISVVD